LALSQVEAMLDKIAPEIKVASIIPIAAAVLRTNTEIIKDKHPTTKQAKPTQVDESEAGDQFLRLSEGAVHHFGFATGN
jgi:hypothetical protein